MAESTAYFRPAQPVGVVQGRGVDLIALKLISQPRSTCAGQGHEVASLAPSCAPRASPTYPVLAIEMTEQHAPAFFVVFNLGSGQGRADEVRPAGCSGSTAAQKGVIRGDRLRVSPGDRAPNLGSEKPWRSRSPRPGHRAA